MREQLIVIDRPRRRRHVLPTAARLGLGALLATAWLNAAATSQQEVPFQHLGPASTATAPDKEPNSIFETRPAPLLPAAPTPRNK
jgi:hypothetical protein